MQVAPEILRYILGLKLRRFRLKKGMGLKEMAAETRMSISYLSEIEKGRKYPKPEKLLALAGALDVPFDELVSLKVGEELGPVTDLFGSAFMRAFPFHLFGIEMEGLLDLVTDAPSKAGALVRTALEIGHTYDARFEHFLLAALRSYQHMHSNYFPEIETAAAALRGELGADEIREAPVGADRLREVLETQHGVAVAEVAFDRYPALRGLRSVHAGKNRLLINERLLPPQKTFQLARELGYLRLRLEARSTTSSPLKVESFDQVINDFSAAYFAGAVMIPPAPLIDDLKTFFKRTRWSAGRFLAILTSVETTPETFFYRLSQLVPHAFGLNEIFFLRFNHDSATERYRLTKILNMSQLAIFHNLEPHEHYCRRWAGIRLLRSLAGRRGGEKPGPDVSEGAAGDWMATAQRATFVADDMEFFVVTLARPLALDATADTSVSLGFLIDRRFKRRVRFWNDSRVPQVEVGLTCERCGLAEEECGSRAAAPRLFEAGEKRRQQEEQLAQLIADVAD